MERTDKTNYYLDIADVVSERSTCLRRRYGAIIVFNDEIISTGYNGAPRGRKNCVAKISVYLPENGMSFVAASTRRQTPLFRQQDETVSEQQCIL